MKEIDIILSPNPWKNKCKTKQCPCYTSVEGCIFERDDNGLNRNVVECGNDSITLSMDLDYIIKDYTVLKNNSILSIDNLLNKEKEFIIEALEFANIHCKGFAYDNTEKNNKLLHSIKDKL